MMDKIVIIMCNGTIQSVYSYDPCQKVIIFDEDTSEDKTKEILKEIKKMSEIY